MPLDQREIQSEVSWSARSTVIFCIDGSLSRYSDNYKNVLVLGEGKTDDFY